MNKPAFGTDDIESVIDFERYPILDLSTADGRSFVDSCRQKYLDNGFCILPGFVRPQALQILAREANAVSDRAYFCHNTHNVYLTDDDGGRDENDIAGIQEQTDVGSVAYDDIGESSLLRRLYQWDPLKDFIGAVLGKKSFYRFAVPLGACSINVFVDGGAHGWHFDESEFTVTLMLQAPERGGEFEYVPQIRGLSDEKDIVARILKGNREGVVRLPFTEGALLIFGGNRTIHRVTQVKSAVPRLVPVLCYSERPDAVNSDSVRQLFWGRSGPRRVESTGVRR